MGSFRLAINTLHFHRKFNFTEVILETVEESLLHSCTSAINRQGISLPLDRQKYSRRLLTIMKTAINRFIYSLALGRSQILYIIISILQDPVFLVNSRSSLLSAFVYLTINKTLSPEVTKSFCRVPLVLFSQSP